VCVAAESQTFFRHARQINSKQKNQTNPQHGAAAAAARVRPDCEAEKGRQHG
jgi:hypothetical protein